MTPGLHSGAGRAEQSRAAGLSPRAARAGQPLILTAPQACRLLWCPSLPTAFLPVIQGRSCCFPALSSLPASRFPQEPAVQRKRAPDSHGSACLTSPQPPLLGLCLSFPPGREFPGCAVGQLLCVSLKPRGFWLGNMMGMLEDGTVHIGACYHVWEFSGWL